jgi:hypothetical protein
MIARRGCGIAPPMTTFRERAEHREPLFLEVAFPFESAL